jgi:hypothetical protein
MPHARRLAESIPTAALTSIAGFGHLLHPAIIEPLAEAILAHTAPRTHKTREDVLNIPPAAE